MMGAKADIHQMVKIQKAGPIILNDQNMPGTPITILLIQGIGACIRRCRPIRDGKIENYSILFNIAQIKPQCGLYTRLAYRPDPDPVFVNDTLQ